MNLKKRSLENFHLYLVTDSLKPGGKPLLDLLEEAVRGGVDAIELRDKNATDREFVEAGYAVRKLTARSGVLFIVNDRTDVALAVDSDGVHLGQDDMPVEKARELTGGRKIIGVSTHSLDQAIDAEKRGADYIGVGPVFKTPTKPEYSAVGLALVKEVKERVRIPQVAIGGIDLYNIDDVISHGADRVAVVRAIINAEDAALAARSLKSRLYSRGGFETRPERGGSVN